VHLYPFIGEFLAEWTRLQRPGMELAQIIGGEHSARANEVRELLNRNGIPAGFYQAGSPSAQRLIEERGATITSLPAVLLQDGSVLLDPSDAQIMDAIGESPGDLECDVAVVGGGPAGLSAAMYAGSDGLRTLIVERHVIGGQAGASSLIRNYLGYPRGISGAELTQRAYHQAWLFGARFVFSRGVTGLRENGATKLLTLSDGREIACRSVIVATGASYRRLEVPDLERFVGQSIFYTTPSEARILRDLDVTVVGGGNSAGQAVVHIATFARKVTLIVRSDSLAASMSDYLLQRIRGASNVEIRLGAEIVGGDGGERLETLAIRDRARNVVENMPASLLFVMIGAVPHTDWLADVVQRDGQGFVLTGADVALEEWPGHRPVMSFETSMPGVFAIGDVRHGSTKRLATAVGEGAGAVQSAHQYLDEAMRLEAPLASRR
jgi:thioredoxin reductase (NADPH)